MLSAVNKGYEALLPGRHQSERNPACHYYEEEKRLWRSLIGRADVGRLNSATCPTCNIRHRKGAKRPWRSAFELLLYKNGMEK